MAKSQSVPALPINLQTMSESPVQMASLARSSSRPVLSPIRGPPTVLRKEPLSPHIDDCLYYPTENQTLIRRMKKGSAPHYTYKTIKYDDEWHVPDVLGVHEEVDDPNQHARLAGMTKRAQLAAIEKQDRLLPVSTLIRHGDFFADPYVHRHPIVLPKKVPPPQHTYIPYGTTHDVSFGQSRSFGDHTLPKHLPSENTNYDLSMFGYDYGDRKIPVPHPLGY